MAFYLKRICKEQECEREIHARGLCNPHYRLFLKHGNTQGIQHKKSRTSEYKTWLAIKERCYKPNSKSYKYYGARGIKLCDRWHTVENFIEDMGLRPSPKHSIDRIDNNGDYEPSNCRWVTTPTQNFNKRYRKAGFYRGVYKSGKNWMARIQQDGLDIYLGTFSTPEAAAIAWNKRAKEYRGDMPLNKIGTGYGVL